MSEPFQVYREISRIEVVAESDVLSRSRLRLYVSATLGEEEWRQSVAAPVIWHNPDHWESKLAMPVREAALMAQALGVNITTLISNAAKYWRAKDAALHARIAETRPT